MDSMQGSDGLDFLDSFPRNESSSLGERLETSRQGEGHAFEQTSMGHIGEWMPIQNAFEIGHETQPARNLSQTTKERLGIQAYRRKDSGFSGSPHRK